MTESFLLKKNVIHVRLSLQDLCDASCVTPPPHVFQLTLRNL